MGEMHVKGNRGGRRLGCLWLFCLLFALSTASQALAAEEPPYEFSAELSLTGGCGTSKADPTPDPGCPEKKPPKSFTSPRAIAIDAFGNEYVASYGAEEGKQGRIDVFSPKGVFITEIKDEFGPKSLAVDSKGNVYAFDSRPESNEIARYSPSVYKPEEGKLEWGSRSVLSTFSSPSVGGVAVDAANDNLFVARGIEIDKYSSAEAGNKLLETITDEKLHSTNFVAVDGQRRRLYASSCPTGDITKCWVLVFNADKPTELLKEVKGPNVTEEGFASAKGWISIAVDEENGDFFVGDLEQSKNVYQFNAKYELVSTLALNPEIFEGGEPMQIALSNAPEGTKNRTYLFVPSLKNRALAFSPPIEQPAKVKSISVAAIGEEEAELLATIEPRGGETTYVFEYLSQQEYEEAGNSFEGARVAGEGTILPAEQEAEVTAPIGSLSPETEYRFRVSAENNVGGEAKEATFATYGDAPITGECPEAIRSTYSTLLPDCRAYELVTPADTNGRPPKGIGSVGDQFTTVEASPNGSAVSFVTEGGVIPGLGGTGSFAGDLYRTVRTPDGWSTESAGPNGEETLSVAEGSTSPDQGFSFWTATRGGSAVIEGEDTHYVRYPDGHSELVGRGSLGTDPKAHGSLITEDGTHIVFQTQGFNGKQPVQLEENAPPTGTEAVYDRTADEVTHVVSLLPGDETPKAGENAGYAGASADGEGIAFRIGSELYLRVGNETTYEIAENVAFAGVAEGGSRIFYLEGGDLFAFDTASEEVIHFTEVGNAVPINVASDGTRAYFVSTTAITSPEEPNPNGAVAEPGEENLYLSEEGTIRFVATVTKRDVVGGKDLNGSIVDGLGLWVTTLKEEGRIARDPSRANPSGTVLLFQSRADLDGYDPEGAPEVYRYDSAGNRLHCISCIPTRTSAAGGASLESYDPGPEGAIGPFAATGFIPNLRADGKRVVFQSTEALVSRDNDGIQDVYEWEEQGVGSCARAGGCVYLVSSGHSDKPNYLYSVSVSGNDVFFITGDVLAGGDNNTLSIYDARVNGGFPESTPIPCQETDKCRGAASPPPSFPFPTSEGLGQLGETPGVKCPKGKHKVVRDGQEVCAKNKKKQKKHHRKHNKTKKGAGK